MRLRTVATGSLNSIQGDVAGKARWQVKLGDGAAESGSNAGSNFALTRFNDAGAAIDQPLSITRNNGAANFVAGVGATTYTATQGLVQILKGSATNPALYFNDNSTNRSAFFFDVASGRTQMTDVYSGASLFLDPPGNFSYNAGSGVAYKTGGGSWTAASDKRIKTVLGDYELGLEQIKRLQPIRYVYKGNDTPTASFDKPRISDDEPKVAPHKSAAPYPASSHHRAAKDKTPFVGLVADDVKALFPEMVKQREGFIDGKKVTDLKDLDTSSLVFALVNAVKTLAAKIEALERGAR
jgi:hypothetical protein